MLRYAWTSFAFITCYSFLTVQAQQFTLVNADLVGVGRSSVAWADYDSDGDLDILITGNPGSGPYVASIYRNDDGSFININAGLTGIDNSSVAWGDYDNDGDLDILATGRSSGSTRTWLYHNDNGIFTAENTGFPNIGPYGSVAWGDIDGDGDLDALISGNYSTRLFRNDSGTFVELNIPLPMVSNSWVNIGDYDNDGDQDLFVMGDVGGWPVSVICRNDGGNFTGLDSTGILPLSGGSASWCDYDHDNDLDVLVSGFDQYLEPKTYIFRNDGNLTFTNIWPGLTGAALGTAAWGDYDNDGYADILLTGQNAACGSLSSIVYHNDGNGNFNDINAPLDGAERGSAAWGDYDNDGDLDIIISGFNESGQAATKLYRNNSGSNTFSVNSAPDSPSGLHSLLLNDHTIRLAWEQATDNTTPIDGITYNLRVGSSPGGQDVMSAFTDVSGFRLVPQPGNMGNDTSWLLNLAFGTYYWSVQAMDHGLGHSSFAPEQQFTITNVGYPERQRPERFIAWPNPFIDKLKVTGRSDFRLEVYNGTGHLIYSSMDSRKGHIISTGTWPPGMYYLRVPGEKHTDNRLLIKK